MKFITLNKLNESLRSFFDTIILPTIKKRRIIVWDKLINRTVSTNSVTNAGEYKGEAYSYVSEVLTLDSKGKTIKIYGPNGEEELTGVISIELEGTDSASLSVLSGNYCYKIKGSY